MAVSRVSRAHASHETWHPQSSEEREAVLYALDDILASAHFCNSKRYPALLKYIVGNSLAGRADLLKERTLGVEVFDRPPTYDTNTDTVVRYTAGEVRKRLLLYYSELGHAPVIRISLPAGSYVPEFFYGSPQGEEGILSLEGRSPVLELESAAHREGEVSPPAGLSVATVPAQLAPSTETRKKLRWGRLAWPVLAAGLLLMSAAVIWRETRAPSPASAVDDFWSPVVRDQHTVVVCAGSVVFAQNNYSGVITADDNTDYPFFSMQTTSAITAVAGLLERSGAGAQLLSAPSTSLTGLREHSVALIGAYNNQWTLRLIEPLRYHFVFDGATPQKSTERIVDGTQPQTEWQRDTSKPYASADDYAIVARFRDPRIDGWIVVMAGLGRNGTEAAAQFATSPHYLEELRQHLGSSFGTRNVEAVLRINVIKGETGAPFILDVYTW